MENVFRFLKKDFSSSLAMQQFSDMMSSILRPILQLSAPILLCFHPCRIVKMGDKFKVVPANMLDGIKVGGGGVALTLVDAETIEVQDFNDASMQYISYRVLKPDSLNCCGLEWMLDKSRKTDVGTETDFPSYGIKKGTEIRQFPDLVCAFPTSLKGVALQQKTEGVWDPDSVKNDGVLICSCDDPQKLLQGVDEDGNPNCVDTCGTKHVRRGNDGDENDICDRCRFDEDSADLLSLDEHCITCKAGDTLGFPDICTECTDNYYLKASQGCVKDCGLDTKGGTHLGFRNVGEDEDGRTCEACADTDNCNKCADDAKVCTECTNDHHLHNGECVKDCPSQLKLKQCNDTKTFRAASVKDTDYLWRFVPSGGKRDATTNILTGSVCKETVVEDKTKPTTSFQLSPEVTHTRDSTLLLSVTFNDAGSATVTGMDFDDVAFTPNGQAQPADGVGRVLAKDAYLQVEFQKQGKVTIDLPADIALDESCNKNAAATSVSVTYDIDPPTVSITSFTTSPPQILWTRLKSPLPTRSAQSKWIPPNYKTFSS